MLIKLARHFKHKYFPSQKYLHHLVLQRWFADGGDYELRFNYDLDENSVVLDLGGYRGQWASDLFSRYQCRIYIFEPVKSFAAGISQRFQKNQHIDVLPIGLGGHSRTESISVEADSSSIYGSSGLTEIIELVDVVEWITQARLEKIDLIKINIEGGEYELLDRLIDSKFLRIIENIQVQFHNIADNSRVEMSHIQNRLRETHSPTYQYEFVWENWTLDLPP